MLQSRILLSVIAAAAASCASSGGAAAPEEPVSTSTDVSPSGDVEATAAEAADGSAQAAAAGATSMADTARAVPAAHHEEGAGGPGGAGGATLSASELALWNDPGFRRWFTESYVAETEIEPRVTLGEREVMEEVLELIAANEMDEAAELLEGESGPAASAVLDFTFANIRLQDERFAEAAAAYLVAVEKHPKFRRAWRNLGIAHMRLDQFEQALPAFTRVIELGGGDAITYGLIGFAYSSVQNDLAAESAYRMAILLDPSTVDFELGLARTLFRQQRYAEAASLCGKLITANPDKAELWLLQANAFIGLEQPLRAAENFELVDRLGGATVESLNVLGDIYVNEGLYDQAVVAYGRAMELAKSRDPELGLRAAKVLASRGALDGSRHLIERIEALFGDELGPDDEKDLLRLRARIAVASGAGEEEARILEEIVTLDPLDGEALILLGQHHFHGGDYEQAIFYFERAANLEASEADAKLGQAQVLVAQQRYAEALPLLRRAQMLKPRDNVQAFLEDIERLGRAR